MAGNSDDREGMNTHVGESSSDEFGHFTSENGARCRLSVSNLLTSNQEPLSTQHASASSGQCGFRSNTDLVTPPSSTHEYSSSTDTLCSAVKSPARPLVCSSLSSRRGYSSKNLDIDALRRERQFSGPYSAIPLLSRKRSHSIADEQMDDSEVLGRDESHVPPNRGKFSMSLPQMSPAPYVSHHLSRFQVPLKSPESPMGFHQHYTPQNREFPKTETKGYGADKMSISSETNPPPESSKRVDEGNPGVRNYIPTPTEKKAKFMYHCEKIWDLLQKEDNE